MQEVFSQSWSCVVIDKPAGLLVQRGIGEHQQGFLITRLREDDPDLHLIHRLDRDTSPGGRSGERRVCVGEVLCSLGNVSSQALCGSIMAVGGGWSVRVPARALSHQAPRYGAHPQGRTALTLWRRVDGGMDWTQLWLCPENGRSHQLRARPFTASATQSSAIRSTNLNPLGRLHLHAVALRARHPFTGIHSGCAAVSSVRGDR